MGFLLYQNPLIDFPSLFEKKVVVFAVLSIAKKKNDKQREFFEQRTMTLSPSSKGNLRGCLTLDCFNSFYIPPTLYLHEKFTFMVGLWLTGSKMMCFPNLTHGAKPWRLFRGFCLAPMRCNNSGKCHVLFSFFSKWHYVSNIFCFFCFMTQTDFALIFRKRFE